MFMLARIGQLPAELTPRTRHYLEGQAELSLHFEHLQHIRAEAMLRVFSKL